MKTELTKTGWNEIQTKEINVQFKAKAALSASAWVDFTKRHPALNTGGRNHCDRCKTRWDQFTDNIMTYYVMTDKGNKVVCQLCWDAIPGNGISGPKKEEEESAVDRNWKRRDSMV